MVYVGVFPNGTHAQFCLTIDMHAYVRMSDTCTNSHNLTTTSPHSRCRFLHSELPREQLLGASVEAVLLCISVSYDDD